MKKLLVSLLAAVFALALCACSSGGGGADVQAPSSTSSGTESTDAGGAEQAAASETPTIEETVLVDEAGIKITATGIDMDGWMGPEVNLLVENNSGKSLTIQARGASVNGYMCEPIMSVDVADGKQANETLTLSESDLELAGVDNVAEIEVSFVAVDFDNWEDYLVTEPVTIQTSIADSYEQAYDDSGDMVYEGDGIQIIVKGLDEDSSWIGPGVVVEIINNSDQDYTVQARDASVNGFMIDPWFSCDVCAGKRAVDAITFSSSDLEDNGIEAIENVELYFTYFDMETWADNIDTDVITMEF